MRGSVESLEEASFKAFNPAFVGLVGRQTPLSDADMQAFTDCAMALKMPPNPVRALDNSLSATEQSGRDIYINVNNITGLGSCNHCHRLNAAAGQFGTGGLMSFEGFRITENFKVSHLRNMYTKLGMFGFSADAAPAMGPQIRGFGFSNDGSAREQAPLDGGVAPGWSHTGEWFKPGGPTPVCRFYGSVSPGPNSHFYTAIDSECTLLKNLQLSLPRRSSA